MNNQDGTDELKLRRAQHKILGIIADVTCVDYMIIELYREDKDDYDMEKLKINFMCKNIKKENNLTDDDCGKNISLLYDKNRHEYIYFLCHSAFKKKTDYEEEYKEKYGTIYIKYIDEFNILVIIRIKDRLKEHLINETEKYRICHNVLQSIQYGILVVNSNKLCLYMNQYLLKLINKEYGDMYLEKLDKLFDNKIIQSYETNMNIDKYEINENIYNINIIKLCNGHTCLIFSESNKIKHGNIHKYKKDILVKISHDVRTPLNGIMGMTDLLSSELKDEQLEYINIIKQCSDNLLDIIDNILEYSMLESNDVKIKEEIINIVECIEESFENIRDNAEKKKLQLSYYIKDDVPSYMIGDYYQLRKILKHLLSNAMKFTNVGKILIKVYLVEINKIKFDIIDTGNGMSTEESNTIFDGRKGMGLITVKKICELLNGTINVKSKIGEGSTFSFILPFKEATDIEEVHKKYENIFKGKKVLIIENDHEIRLMLSKIFIEWGVNPITATTYDEAMMYINSDIHLDLGLINTDINLKNKVDIPLIFISSTVPKNKYEYCLVKPIRKNKLFDMCVRIFNNNKQVTNIPILVADDLITNQDVAKKLLNKLGYTDIDIVSNGLEALQAIQHKKYKLLLLDIMMPVMDGYTTAKKICNKYSKKDRPYIIALTAGSYKEFEEKCYNAGMDGFMSKPVKIKELQMILNAISQS